MNRTDSVLNQIKEQKVRTNMSLKKKSFMSLKTANKNLRGKFKSIAKKYVQDEDPYIYDPVDPDEFQAAKIGVHLPAGPDEYVPAEIMMQTKAWYRDSKTIAHHVLYKAGITLEERREKAASIKKILERVEQLGEVSAIQPNGQSRPDSTMLLGNFFEYRENDPEYQ